MSRKIPLALAFALTVVTAAGPAVAQVQTGSILVRTNDQPSWRRR